MFSGWKYKQWYNNGKYMPYILAELQQGNYSYFCNIFIYYSWGTLITFKVAN